MTAAPDLSTTPLTGLFDLRGHTAVITGAARGIGRACAHRLAEAGAHVIGADIAAPAPTPDPREDAPGLVGPEVRLLDVTDPTAVASFVDTIVAETGRIDIWVNAAGIFPRAGLLEIELDDWRRVFAVNVEGSFVAAQHAARHMSAAGSGVIVNLASTVASRVNNNAAHYRASKAALISLTHNLAVELGPCGVRALAVCPTLTFTDGVEALGADRASLEKFGQRLPLGRAAVPDDIARVVLFAVSPLASFMTGSALDVDGGELHR